MGISPNTEIFCKSITIERAPFEALIGYILNTYGGFLEWGYPKMDGL